MKKFYIVLLLSVISFTTIIAQKQPVFVTDSLDNYINNALERWQVPGAAVLIVKDGKIVTAKGYGVKEMGKDDKVDANTLFLIGSNTKAFTSTALALLESEGKCKLDDKVVKYLDGFKMKDPWVTGHVNLFDIVSHRMGLQTFQGDFMYWTSDLTSDEVIEKFGEITPVFEFRTRYGYTNAGYAVAGKIIEKISGKSWDKFIREKIFIPLNMSRSTALSVDYAAADNIAKPHTFVNNKMSPIKFQSIDNLAPCGSIASSVNDMQGWIIAQLDSGKYNGENVIPYSVINRTRQPQTIVRRNRHPFNKTHYLLYAMGWNLEDYENREIVSHTGGVNGFVTSVTLIPEEQLGVVVLTNTDQNAFFQSLKWEIIDAYLGLPYRDYDGYMYSRTSGQKADQDAAIAALKDSASMNIQPEFDLDGLPGKYENEVYGYAELVPKENYIELKLQHHPGQSGRLEYIGNNRFLCTYADPLYGIKVFQFEIENGKVKAFTLYVDDFVDYMPYRFEKIE